MINETLTIGLELEGLSLSPRGEELIARYGLSRHNDASVRDEHDNRGLELVTGILPVSVVSDDEGKNLSIDYGNAYATIEALCESIAEVNTTCGLHVHLGRPDPKRPGKSLWKPDHVRTWLAIGSMLEEKLYDIVPASRKNNPHCFPIRQRYSNSELQSFYPTGPVAPRKDQNSKRYCWLNVIETRRVGDNPQPGRMASEATGTVEIRLLGNTRRVDYIWAWTQLWTRVAAYIAYLPSTFAMMHCVVTGSISSDWERVRSKKNRSEDDAPTIRNAPSTISNDLRPLTPNPILTPTLPTPVAPVPDAPASPAAPARRARRPRTPQPQPTWVRTTTTDSTSDEVVWNNDQPIEHIEVVPSVESVPSYPANSETRDGLQRQLDHARNTDNQGAISTLEEQMARLLEQEESRASRPISESQARRRALRRLTAPRYPVSGTATGRYSSSVVVTQDAVTVTAAAAQARSVTDEDDEVTDGPEPEDDPNEFHHDRDLNNPDE